LFVLPFICAHAFLGVVHAVSYSILLLNTDLHIADLSTHMSRNQFVRNTVQAIQSQIRPSGPSFARSSTPDLTYDDASSAHARSEGSEAGGSTLRSRSKRSSSVHSWTSVSREALNPLGTPSMGTSSGQLTTSPTGPCSLNASTVSVQTPTSGQISNSAEPKIRTAGSQSSSSVTSIVYGRNWDVEMEGMLRVSDWVLFKMKQVLIARSRKCTVRSKVPKSGSRLASSRHPIRCHHSLPIRLTTLSCAIGASAASQTAWLCSSGAVFEGYRLSLGSRRARAPIAVIAASKAGIRGTGALARPLASQHLWT
jgi:hypothetical protein